MCRQEGGVLDGRIGRGLGETPYRYFRIWSAPSVLSLRTSGYRDLLATLQEKQPDPRIVTQSPRHTLRVSVVTLLSATMQRRWNLA